MTPSVNSRFGTTEYQLSASVHSVHSQFGPLHTQPTCSHPTVYLATRMETLLSLEAASEGAQPILLLGDICFAVAWQWWVLRNTLPKICPFLLGHSVYRSVSVSRITVRLTLRLLMSYIYGAPSKARNANVVYIWTYVWQR